jgi:PKHD-type hydroxylase
MNENEINKLRSQCQNLPFTDGTIGSNNTVNSYRRSKTCFIPRIWQFTEIYLKIFNFINKINKDTFKYNLNETEKLQYTEYDESYQGHYDWHIDTGANNSSRRKLSISIQLSDSSEYEGGELQLNGGGPITTCKKTKGTIIMFPSFLLHRVTPVTKGTRRSLVVWVTGPPFV